jgi:hypothetical protein
VAAIPNVAIDGHVTVSSDPTDPIDPPDPPPTGLNVIAHAFPSKTVVGQGYNLYLNLTTTNEGSSAGAFYVASYANTTQVAKRTLAVSIGSSTTISVVWNTTGFAYGNYSIYAYAWPIPEQMNVNETSVDGWVIVTIPGDLNGDFTIDIRDAILAASAFNSKPNNPNWNPNADLNEDNAVDIYDATIVANHFGQQV